MKNWVGETGRKGQWAGGEIRLELELGVVKVGLFNVTK